MIEIEINPVQPLYASNNGCADIQVTKVGRLRASMVAVAKAPILFRRPPSFLIPTSIGEGLMAI